MVRHFKVLLIPFICSVLACFGPFDPYNWPEDDGSDADTSGDAGAALGLIAYWNCNDSIGSTLRDSVAGLNATISGAEFDSSGVAGGGLRFDGKDNQAVVYDEANKGLPLGTADFTISLWVKPLFYQDVHDTLRYDIISKGLIRERGYTIAIAGKSFTAVVGRSKNDLRDTKFDASVSAWYHLVLLRRKSAVEFWVNSEKILEYSNDDDLTVPDSKLIFGNNASINGRNGFPGIIDEVKIYSRAWSASTIRSVFNKYKQ